ncbi:MAG TPA: hypothetical protein VIF57_14750 [Polyangia bacterium]
MRARFSAASGAAWVVALAGATVGCARFAPTVPMHARTSDVDLAVESLGVRGPQVVLASRSTAPHTVVRAWATVPSRSPCRGGLEADALTIDDGPGIGGTLTPGAHAIALRFPQGSVDFGLDTFADIEIEDGNCLRVPVLSQSVPLVPISKPPVFTIGMGVLGNTELSGLRAVTSFEVGAGAWLGPVLLNGQVGVGAAICTELLCGKSSDGQLNSGVAVPLALEARYALGAGVIGRLQSAGFVGARYAFEPVWLPAIGGQRSLQVHTVHAVLGWGFGDAVPGPFRRLERAVPFEVAVPLGIAAAPGAPDGRVAFTGGLTLRVLFNLPR